MNELFLTQYQWYMDKLYAPFYLLASKNQESHSVHSVLDSSAVWSIIQEVLSPVFLSLRSVTEIFVTGTNVELRFGRQRQPQTSEC